MVQRLPVFHYAQTRFKGTDENGNPVVLSSQYVRLLAPGQVQ